MIYVQHGPSWGPKIEMLLENKIIDGIIWDPREEGLTRIKEVKDSNLLYSNVNHILDLKWYYKQFPNSLMKKLEDLKYFPLALIDRAYLRDSNNYKEHLVEMKNVQDSIGVNCYMAPSLYITGFNDRYIDRILDILDTFKDVNSSEKYISLMINEIAFDDNSGFMEDFIQDISAYAGIYKGIYIVIDRDISCVIRNLIPAKKLSKIMQFVYFLKNIGFEVAIGYSGIESITMMAVGTDIIATGWFYSLRRFNKLEKGLETYSGMGRAKKRYTSLNFLNELKIEENIQSLPENEKDIWYNLIFNGYEIDKEIKDKNISLIQTNITYLQYFQTMKEISNIFEKLDKVSEKINKAEEMIKNAIKNTIEYNKLSYKYPAIQALSKEHLESYLEAIQIFREQNFI
jgi:hypothetical protein